MITNGNFSLGNTGFSTDYLVSGTAGPGKYGISTTPWTANSYWSHCTDHTTGTGNLMWIDCATSGSLNIWTQTASNLSSNTDYFFSCWVTSLDGNGPATLEFSINGQPIGNPLTASDTTCYWVQFCFVWNSGVDNSATITITNQSLFAVGNDVAIDDISLRVCCQPISHNVFAFICNGETYQLPGGTTVTTTGIYNDTLASYLGCDSVVVSYLAVLPTSSLLQNISICSGQSYFAGGAFQTTSGTYFDTLVNFLSCDSVITTNLTVLPTSSATINVSICDGQSYFAGGAFQTTTGSYSDVLVNYLGCDSFLTTNLTVLPTSSLLQNISICNGQSYFAGGAFQTSGGTYFDTLVNYLGCDSVITTNLTILPNSSFTVNAAICQGQSYFAGGAFQTVSGAYLDSFTNYLGCDSVLTTNLTVLSNTSFAHNVSICDGQSYFAGGALQTLGGTYLDTLVNYLGCDSVITTNLTVLPNSSATVNAAICDGQFYFAGGGFQASPGTYLDVLVNYLGCDSFLTTNLTVLPTSSLLQNISICNGQSYFAGGAFQTSGGTYFDTLLNYLGCDSVITTNLTILPNSSFTVNASICQGQSYFAAGAFQTVSGAYLDSFTNYLGCDSVLTTNLTVLSNTSFTHNVSICDGQSYFAGGALQTLGGTYLDTLVNYLGCDSVLTTNLTILSITYFSQAISICQGQSYYAGGSWQTTGDTYFDTIANYLGCDSVITTTLNVIQPVYQSQIISICQGQSYFVGGNWQTQSGVYVDTLVSYVGCDSILSTSLQVILPLSHDVSVSICLGQSYYAGGTLQTQAGIYHDTLVAASGCDSILITNLSVLNPVFSNVNAAICEGQTYLAQGAYQTVSGTYHDTLSSYLGCDSIILTQLTVNENPVVNLGNDTSICEGTTLVLTPGSSFQSYLWQDLSTSNSFSAPAAGTFWVRVRDENDCVGADSLTILSILPSPKNFLPADSIICGKISRYIVVPGFDSYQWSDGSLSSSFTVSSSGIYWLQVQDQNNGCFGRDSIVYKSVCDESVLLPNAFTPNKDGLNDIFKPVLLDDITNFEMKIFSRWGKLIFYSKDPAVGWNGEEAGIPLPIQEYVWTAQYKDKSGEEKFLKGTVTLLR